MSMVKDLATEATWSLTCSRMLGLSSAAAVVVVVGAASPPNLSRILFNAVAERFRSRSSLLVRHHNKKSFRCELVRLQLVVR